MHDRVNIGLGIGLQKHPSFLGLLITNVEPIVVTRMIDLAIFDNIIRVNKVARFEISIWLDCSRRTKCQRPVFDRSSDRFPETMTGGSN